MPVLASATAADRANAFDAVRCLLAVGVLYSHTFVLGGYGYEHVHGWTKGQTIVGQLCVLGFFGLSGFLVTASFERSRGTLDYLKKRARRILPGLWACLAVTAFVLAPALFALRHDGSLGGFHWLGGGESALGFFLRNLAVDVRQWSVAGVLDGAKFNESLNGSLWSLWPETLSYLIVAALGAAGALGRNRLLFLLGLGALFALHAAHELLPAVSSPALPTWLVLTDRARYFLAYFVGAALWLWRDRYAADRPAALLVLVVLAALARFGGLQILSPVFVPLALILVGQCLTVHLRHDLSYGLYIYGFPVQQLLAATALARSPWWVFFAASVALTGVFAFLSWRFVESPFLRRRAAVPAA